MSSWCSSAFQHRSSPIQIVMFTILMILMLLLAVPGRAHMPFPRLFFLLDCDP
jgi:hypothetical protein